MTRRFQSAIKVLRNRNSSRTKTFSLKQEHLRHLKTVTQARTTGSFRPTYILRVGVNASINSACRMYSFKCPFSPNIKKSYVPIEFEETVFFCLTVLSRGPETAFRLTIQNNSISWVIVLVPSESIFFRVHPYITSTSSIFLYT